MITLFVIISFLIYLSWQDWQYMEVNSKEVYIVAFLSLLLINNIHSLFVTFGVLSILFFSRHMIGEADIIIITALTCTVPLMLIPYWILLIGIFNLIIHQYINNHRIPMLPSIAASYCVIKFLSLMFK